MKTDVLFAFGGVFMYFDKEDVDRLFRSLKDLKAIVILDEGADSDWIREDKTTMFDFVTRLKENGYAERNFYIEKQEDRPIYKIFAMW